MAFYGVLWFFERLLRPLAVCGAGCPVWAGSPGPALTRCTSRRWPPTTPQTSGTCCCGQWSCSQRTLPRRPPPPPQPRPTNPTCPDTVLNRYGSRGCLPASCSSTSGSSATCWWTSTRASPRPDTPWPCLHVSWSKLNVTPANTRKFNCKENCPFAASAAEGEHTRTDCRAAYFGVALAAGLPRLSGLSSIRVGTRASS